MIEARPDLLHQFPLLRGLSRILGITQSRLKSLVIVLDLFESVLPRVGQIEKRVKAQLPKDNLELLCRSQTGDIFGYRASLIYFHPVYVPDAHQAGNAKHAADDQNRHGDRNEDAAMHKDL